MHRTGRKAQGLEARQSQNLITTLITSGLFELSVMGSIDLHDQSPVETDEVENVVENRRLFPEVKPVSPQGPQPQPKPDFLYRHGLSQRPRAFDAHGAAPPDPFGATSP